MASQPEKADDRTSVPDTTPPHPASAHDALEHLLGSLHRHGFLHLATEVVSANARLADTFVDALDKPGMQSGIRISRCC